MLPTSNLTGICSAKGIFLGLWVHVLGVVLWLHSVSSAEGVMRRIPLQGTDRTYGVWEVSPSGKASRVPLDLKGARQAISSPDDNWLVLASGKSISLHNYETGAEITIGEYGIPEVPSTWCPVYIVTWSPDSKRVLYFVNGWEPWGDMVPPPNWRKLSEWCSERAGLHLYELESGRSERVDFPFDLQFEAWLPDGRIIYLPPTPPRAGLYVFSAEDSIGHPLVLDGFFRQVAADSAGQRLVSLRYLSAGSQEELVVVDTATGEVSPVQTISERTQASSPSLSPSGHRTAYLSHEMSLERPFNFTLIVDGIPVCTCDCGPTPRYRWLNDTTISIGCCDKLLVIDARTGDILSEYALSSEGEP